MFCLFIVFTGVYIPLLLWYQQSHVVTRGCKMCAAHGCVFSRWAVLNLLQCCESGWMLSYRKKRHSKITTIKKSKWVQITKQDLSTDELNLMTCQEKNWPLSQELRWLTIRFGEGNSLQCLTVPTRKKKIIPIILEHFFVHLLQLVCHLHTISCEEKVQSDCLSDFIWTMQTKNHTVRNDKH